MVAGLLTDFLVGRRIGGGGFDVGIAAAAILFLLICAALMLPISGTALLVVAGGTFLGAFAYAPGAATLQMVTPPQLRSRAAALFLLMAVVVQMIGNSAIGILNDAVFGGKQGIAWSFPLYLATVSLGSVIALTRGRAALGRFLRL